MTWPHTVADADFLRLAIEQAQLAGSSTSPNPAVGCVLVSNSGELIGAGHTQPVGGPHAEIMALRHAADRGHGLMGSIAYVTLEPCAHFGRTGPCCDALVGAGVRHVVATNVDPNPLVAGKGFQRMREAGVVIDVLDPTDPLAIESRELNIGFFSRMIRKTPWVRMKAASSLDGKTALTNGISQWITSTEARADGHSWRARSSAVLTGIGTVLADNPKLDVRHVPTPRQPHVVVVDSRLETPLDAALWLDTRKTFIYTAAHHPEKQAGLEAKGATVVVLPDSNGKVDLHAMMLDLGKREINELHVEAGHKLNGSLLSDGLVDELLLYIAPKLIGEGSGIAQLSAISNLADAHQLDFRSIERIGPDLRLIARLTGHDQF